MNYGDDDDDTTTTNGPTTYLCFSWFAQRLGCATYDRSTGYMFTLPDVEENTDFYCLARLLQRVDPDIILVAKKIDSRLKDFLKRLLTPSRRPNNDGNTESEISMSSNVTNIPNAEFSVSRAKTQLEKFEVAVCTGNSTATQRLIYWNSVMPLDATQMLKSTGALLSHLTRENINIITRNDGVQQPALTKVMTFSLSSFLYVEPNSYWELSIFSSTLRPAHTSVKREEHNKDGLCLFSLMNSTRTSLGSKLFRLWFKRPSNDLSIINFRLDFVDWIQAKTSRQSHLLSIRTVMARITNILPSLMRFISAMNTPTLGSLMSLKKTFVHLNRLASIINAQQNTGDDVPRVYSEVAAACGSRIIIQAAELIEHIVDPKMSRANGRVVPRIGIDEALDLKRRQNDLLPELLTAVAQRLRMPYNPNDDFITITTTTPTTTPSHQAAAQRQYSNTAATSASKLTQSTTFTLYPDSPPPTSAAAQTGASSTPRHVIEQAFISERERCASLAEFSAVYLAQIGFLLSIDEAELAMTVSGPVSNQTDGDTVGDSSVGTTVSGAKDAHPERGPFDGHWTHVFSNDGRAYVKTPTCYALDAKYGDLKSDIKQAETRIIDSLVDMMMRLRESVSLSGSTTNQGGCDNNDDPPSAINVTPSSGNNRRVPNNRRVLESSTTSGSAAYRSTPSLAQLRSEIADQRRSTTSGVAPAYKVIDSTTYASSSDIHGDVVETDGEFRDWNDAPDEEVQEDSNNDSAAVKVDEDDLLSMTCSALEAVAQLDCLATLAEYAARHRVVRPVFVSSENSGCDNNNDDDEYDDIEGHCLEIVNGRHLLHEVTMESRASFEHTSVNGLGAKQQFVPNDASSNALSNDHATKTTTSSDRVGRVHVVRGPNASGKSVYLKQTAMIVFLAHIGAYVPADSCRLSRFTSLHAVMTSRASVAHGLSSFVTDIDRVSLAIKSAQGRSLLMLDDIGGAAGTRSDDAQALVAGMVAHWARKGRSPEDVPHVFVATHGDPIALIRRHPRVDVDWSLIDNLRMKYDSSATTTTVNDAANDLVFHYKVERVDRTPHRLRPRASAMVNLVNSRLCRLERQEEKEEANEALKYARTAFTLARRAFLPKRIIDRAEQALNTLLEIPTENNSTKSIHDLVPLSQRQTSMEVEPVTEYMTANHGDTRQEFAIPKPILSRQSSRRLPCKKTMSTTTATSSTHAQVSDSAIQLEPMESAVFQFNENAERISATSASVTSHKKRNRQPRDENKKVAEKKRVCIDADDAGIDTLSFSDDTSGDIDSFLFFNA